MTDRKTLNHGKTVSSLVKDWKDQVDSHTQSSSGVKIPMVLACNKYDLIKKRDPVEL